MRHTALIRSPLARSWVTGLIVAALLGGYGLMAISATRDKSPAFDELAHLTAGYSYWHLNDYRLHPENGLLPQRWAAIPLLGDDRVRFPSLPQAAWQESFVWGVGHQFFHQRGNDLPRMLWRSRGMVALLGVALGALVYTWSRQLFGRVGGLVSLTLYAFCPTMLAHGGLVTSDMAAALFLTMAVWRWWRLLERVTPLNLVTSTLALAGFCLAKMSWFLLLPIGVLLAAVRLLAGRPFIVDWGRVRQVASRPRQLALLGALFAGQALCVVLIIWAAFGFRYSAFAAAVEGGERFYPGWEEILGQPGAFPTAINSARHHRLLPEAYLYGLSFVIKNSQSRSAFLNGEHSLTGWRTFFPYCLLVKTPPGLFVILGLAGLAAVVSWPAAAPGARAPGWAAVRRRLYAVAPLGILLAVYWAFAIVTRLNIGHRHIVPTYPAMFVLAGAAAVWWERRQRGAVTLLTISALWFLWESLWIRPHYLAYFNLFAGGPAHGYRHLVDSSLDWGQDLPGLKQWLDRRGLANQDQMPVYLSYFGTGDPNYYGIRANWLPGYPDLWSQQTLLPLRGGVYCISATMLQQVYTSSAGRWTTAHEQLYQQIATNIGFYDRARQDQAALDDLQQRYGLAFWNQQFEMFLLLRAGRLCAYLRQREPLDLVGYSILIYRLTDEEIDRALFGPPAELLADNPRLHVSSPASTSQPPRPAAPRQP